eukprot:14722-Heterococcus_DN1.PRE.1
MRVPAVLYATTALSDYEHALVLDPTEVQVYLMKGNALSVLDQHQDALMTYKKALALKPSEIEVRRKVALSELQCGNLDKSTAMVGSVLKKQPMSPDMILLGSALSWNAGELAESEVGYCYLGNVDLGNGCMDKTMYNMAVALDVRLLDDNFLTYGLHWPAVPIGMIRNLRKAGTINRLAAVRTLIGASI